MADVDLRPMSLGEVLDRTFKLYKSNFWLFIGIIALPFLILLMFNVGMAAVHTSTLKTGGVAGTFGLPTVGVVVGAFVGAIVALVIYFGLLGAAQAATVLAVSDLYLGQTPSLMACYKRVGVRAWRVIAILFLVTVIVIVGFLLLIVPGIMLLCRTSLAVQSAMLEDTNTGRSIERSMELTKGYSWQIFFIFVLVWMLSAMVSAIFQIPVTILMFKAAQTHRALSFAGLFMQHLGSFVSEVLVSPIGAIAFALMYYNLRVRKEAFDIQHLMSALEAGPAPGAASVA